ncbi:unnamed protein product [Caretta caretta]
METRIWPTEGSQFRKSKASGDRRPKILQCFRILGKSKLFSPGWSQLITALYPWREHPRAEYNPAIS